MSTKKIRYEKPVVMDIGVSEGLGLCNHGTLIMGAPTCDTGYTPESNSQCSQGGAAVLGCSGGDTPDMGCDSGSFALSK